jgi:TPR repeat protein
MPSGKLMVRLLKLKAKKGKADAQADLALLYDRGSEGLEKNLPEAARLYRLAAEQGNPQGQANLATMLDRGEGVVQNHVEAAKWYKLAGKQGPVPLLRLPSSPLGGMTNHVQTFRRSVFADQHTPFSPTTTGHPGAQGRLGEMYGDGDEGLPQDWIKAAKWHKLAAAQGNITSQYNLGTMHSGGKGLPTNLPEAVKMFTLAAEQGFAKAQCNLGVMCGCSRFLD